MEITKNTLSLDPKSCAKTCYHDYYRTLFELQFTEYKQWLQPNRSIIFVAKPIKLKCIHIIGYYLSSANHLPSNTCKINSNRL